MSKNTITTIEQRTYADHIYFYITRNGKNPHSGYSRAYTWNVDNSLRPISDASVKRIQRVLNSKYVSVSDTHVDFHTTRITFTPNGTMPTRYGKYGPFTVLENWYGNLNITISEEGITELKAELELDENGDTRWQQLDDIMYSAFEGTDLEYDSDYGNPSITDRVYYAEDHPKYSPNDDELGTNWKESKVWGYDRYIFEHPLEALLNKGSIVMHNYTIYQMDED